VIAAGSRAPRGSAPNVTFVNKEDVAHRVVSSSIPSGAVAFASPTPGVNQTFSVTLSVAGTYQYFCSIHGTATSGMRGTIVVN
jgi:plastocyanin